MSFPSASARTKDWGSEVLTDAALEGQLDILHDYNNDSLEGTDGHKHTGVDQDGPKIDLTTSVSNTLPVTNGGTGVATLAAFMGLVYPIGSTYCNITDPTDPATLLGFGTWTAITGRFIIGADSTDTDFDSGGETGGAKTKDLSHTHTVSNTGWGEGPTPSTGKLLVGATDGGASSSTQGITSGSGGSTTQNIMPPFMAGYLWYRIA